MKWKNREGEYMPEAEVVIHFLSSGFYDRGQTYGPPELCYPPEGEDERVLDYVEIDGIELPKEIGEKLFEKYQKQIDEMEIEPPEYEPFEDDAI